MNRTMLSLLVAAAAALLAGGAGAAGNSPQRTPNAMIATDLPAADIDTTVFVDANGDSINDRAPFMRRGETRQMDRERGEQRGQLLNQSMAGLTKAQKDEIKQLRTTMRQQGARPDQIHTAVGEKIRSYGVAVPADWDLTAKEYAVARRLTDAQRAEVQALADSLRRQGKTQAEIRGAVAAKYQALGRPVPGRRSQGSRGNIAAQDSVRRQPRAAVRDSIDAQNRRMRTERGPDAAKLRNMDSTNTRGNQGRQNRGGGRNR